MTGTLYLAWRYLVFHRFKTAVLVTSITLILFLPVGVGKTFLALMWALEQLAAARAGGTARRYGVVVYLVSNHWIQDSVNNINAISFDDINEISKTLLDIDSFSKVVISAKE